MTSPRLRRLMHDYEAVRAECSGHDRVTVTPLDPVPPQVYHVRFRVPGLRRIDGHLEVVETHDVEIRLPLGYPREAPYCIALTPVFHPNIDQHYCIGDFWAAGESLVDVIAKLADMIQWRDKATNPHSPLSASAARYAVENPERFPLSEIDIYRPEVEISLKTA